MKVEQSSANIIRMGNLASLTCIINMLKCQSFIVLTKCKHPTLLYIHKGGYANDMESFAGMNNHLYHININILWECINKDKDLWCSFVMCCNANSWFDYTIINPFYSTRSPFRVIRYSTPAFSCIPWLYPGTLLDMPGFYSIVSSFWGCNFDWQSVCTA